VFGLSFGELVTVLLVAMVVLGPKELPKYLRKAGQLAGRLRRVANDMRQKSGIDEVLRTEGLDRDIAEIRRLTRGELTGVAASFRAIGDSVRPDFSPAATAPTLVASPSPYAAPAPYVQPASSLRASDAVVIDRAREYPVEGADAYGALPEDAPVYEGALAASPLADDPLYSRGEDPAAAEAPS
jgi:sec-independent protein translocase protein TatB